MKQQQESLYQKIVEFDFDEGSPALSFAARLARDNGWSPDFSRRCVREYRRFLFLAMEAGHPVTPSDAVDQVWHLHLTYTRSYWQRLCEEVLPRPLHHDPTQGGPDEDRKYVEWYDQTRESYEALFGEAPPRDIWPDPRVRFRTRFARVNLTRYGLVSRWAFRVLSLTLMAFSTATLTGCTFAALDEFGFTLLIAVLLLVVVIVAIKKGGGGGGGGLLGCSSGCGSSGCGGGG